MLREAMPPLYSQVFITYLGNSAFAKASADKTREGDYDHPGVYKNEYRLLKTK